MELLRPSILVIRPMELVSLLIMGLLHVQKLMIRTMELLECTSSHNVPDADTIYFQSNTYKNLKRKVTLLKLAANVIQWAEGGTEYRHSTTLRPFSCLELQMQAHK